MKIPVINPYVDLLRQNRQYRWLWLSQVISLTGDWFNIIATTTLLSGLARSGLAISALFVARLLPPLLLGPVVGVVADRFDRRKILIASDLLRMVVVLGFLMVRSERDIWLLYGLTLLQLSISSFFEPARSALMPNIVARRDLITANALDGTTWSAMLAIGAALGGVATALFGITAALVIDSLTFALSAWCLTHISSPAPTTAEPIPFPEDERRSFIEGMRYLRLHPHTLVLALIKGAGALSFGVMDLVSVTFAEKIFPIGNSSAATLGLIFTAVGIGTGIAPLVARHFSGDQPLAMRHVLTASFALSVVGFMGVAWAPSLPVLLLATIIRTGGSGTSWVYSSALLQISLPDRYRGRGFAFDFAMFTLAAVTANVWGGVSMDTLGLSPREVAFVAGLIAIVVLLAWLVYHQSYVKQHRTYQEV